MILLRVEKRIMKGDGQSEGWNIKFKMANEIEYKQV